MLFRERAGARAAGPSLQAEGVYGPQDDSRAECVVGETAVSPGHAADRASVRAVPRLVPNRPDIRGAAKPRDAASRIGLGSADGPL